MKRTDHFIAAAVIASMVAFCLNCPAADPEAAPPPDPETTPPVEMEAPAPSPAEPPPPAPGPVQIHSDQVLATVNGVEIKGKNLVLFGKEFADKPQELSSQAYEHLLNAAIDRALIRQAAEKEGVSLTEDQRRQLDEVKETVQSRAGAPWSGSVQYAGTIEEQTDFEQREAETQFLLNDLVAKRGVAQPDANMTDDQVQQYYQEHEAEFEALPENAEARAEAWKTIDFQIRRNFALAAFSEYDAERRKLGAELRTNAEIRVLSPAP